MKIVKRHQTIAAFIIANAIFFTSCTKDNSVEPQNTTEGNLVFFVDTFRLYSSDLEGNNYKALVDEDEKSGNNYINRITYSNNAKKFIYGYKSANGSMQIKVANGDGSNKKVLKSFPATTGISFLGSFGGKIMYSTVDYSASKPAVVLATMEEDGTNETKQNLPNPTLAARNGATLVSTTENYSGTIPSFSSYVMKYKNGTWDEANSFNLSKVTGLLRASAISDDGNTLVYIVASDYTTLTYDVFTLDISKRDNTAKKVYSHTFPATGDGAVKNPPQISIALAKANLNLLVGYGVEVDKQRFATKNDYYYVQNIDIDKGVVLKKWKISGEYGGSLLAN